MIKNAQALTRREMAMGGLLVLLMKSLLSTTLLKGALERRAKNLYSWTHQTVVQELEIKVKISIIPLQVHVKKMRI